jgi:hypothetical protein
MPEARPADNNQPRPGCPGSVGIGRIGRIPDEKFQLAAAAGKQAVADSVTIGAGS